MLISSVRQLPGFNCVDILILYRHINYQSAICLVKRAKHPPTQTVLTTQFIPQGQPGASPGPPQVACLPAPSPAGLRSLNRERRMNFVSRGETPGRPDHLKGISGPDRAFVRLIMRDCFLCEDNQSSFCSSIINVCFQIQIPS